MTTLLTKKPATAVAEVVGQSSRPLTVVFDIVFAEHNRKVSPADLERATQAAAAAFRTSLEDRTPRYVIASLKATLTYAYVQAKRTFSA